MAIDTKRRERMEDGQKRRETRERKIKPSNTKFFS